MSDLHDKEAFFKKAREMAEGLSKEQLIGYYMAELETCCEVEAKLAECEKERHEEWKTGKEWKWEWQKVNQKLEKADQDKISFAVEKLKEVKKLFEEKYTYDVEESDFAVIYEDDVDEIINNQIKKIKGEE